MPRYFFHITDDNVRTEDTIGDLCADLKEVKDNAVGILVHIAQDELPNGDDHSFEIEVTDAGGAVVYSADLTLHSRWGPGHRSEAR